jgi:hypothetical protein
MVPSSGLWHCVDVCIADVSETLTVSIFREKMERVKISEILTYC